LDPYRVLSDDVFRGLGSGHVPAAHAVFERAGTSRYFTA